MRGPFGALFIAYLRCLNSRTRNIAWQANVAERRQGKVSSQGRRKNVWNRWTVLHSQECQCCFVDWVWQKIVVRGPHWGIFLLFICGLSHIQKILVPAAPQQTKLSLVAIASLMQTSDVWHLICKKMLGYREWNRLSLVGWDCLLQSSCLKGLCSFACPVQIISTFCTLMPDFQQCT